MSLDSMPNILFLMSDEHRFNISGFAGDQIIRTPNLNRIAEKGIQFNNAYTPSPVCIPGRQCIMAGQFPSSFGASGWDDLPPGHLTVSRHFSRHAYYTAACGKLHHEGTDQMQGWIHRIGDEMKVSPRYIDEKKTEYFDRYQRHFDDFKWSDQKEILRAGSGSAFHMKMDEYTVQGAENFIDNYFLSSFYDRERGNHQPLMLKVSLLQPHYPYFCEEELFKYYLNRVEPFDDETVSDHPFLSERCLGVGIDVTKRDIRRATAAYYGMVETVDRLFGRVLGALERVGQNLNDWIIIYTSDHGEMLGEHGVWEKQKFFESSVRVPLLISWPSRWKMGTQIYHNVNLTDLFATLCDAVGISIPEGLDSRSLIPLIESENSESIHWNHEIVSMFSKARQPLLHEERNEWIQRSVVSEGGMNLMIKIGDLKYQFYGSDLPEVLFDLNLDPKELENRITYSSYKTQVSQFRSRARELGFKVPEEIE